MVGAVRSDLTHLDGPTHIIDHGGEGTPLVLVHGLGGNALNWMRVGPTLARHHRVFAVDLVGFGRTPLAGRTSTIPGHAALVERLVERVGSPATLVGNSMGGLVSLTVAARRPDLVRSLVLVDPAIPRYDGAPLDRAVVGAFSAYAVPGVGEAWLRKVGREVPPEKLLAYFMSLCGVDPRALPPEVYEAHLDMARYRRGLPWGDAAFLSSARSLLRRVLVRPRWEAIARKVTAPTLLVHGERDRLISVVSARGLARRKPAWRFAELSGVGHTPMLEAPDRFAEVTLAFTADAADAGRRASP